MDPVADGAVSLIFAATDGVVAHALELVDIADVEHLPDGGPFSERERAFAASVSDPERRLAARLAAKRAAVRALGGGLPEADVEVVRTPGGPPTLRLSPAADERLRVCGAASTRVSLTHGRDHAAAVVLLLRAP